MKELITLIDEQKINQRITELANKINEDYKGKEIILVSILKGSIIFTAELAKKLNNPKIKIDFMRVSSYEGENTESSEKPSLKIDLSTDIKGKDIIIVEDIIDTGITLEFLLETLTSRKPNSIKLCTLLDKPERRKTQVKVDYVGFTIPNEFVVGYGLDTDGYYRCLPYVGCLKEKKLIKAKK